jgi:hypothetical protein
VALHARKISDYLKRCYQILIAMMTNGNKNAFMLPASLLLQNTQTPEPGQNFEMLVGSCAFRLAQDGPLVRSSYNAYPRTFLSSRVTRGIWVLACAWATVPPPTKT